MGTGHLKQMRILVVAEISDTWNIKVDCEPLYLILCCILFAISCTFLVKYIKIITGEIIYTLAYLHQFIIIGMYLIVDTSV